jgi:hypothetical protein
MDQSLEEGLIRDPEPQIDILEKDIIKDPEQPAGRIAERDLTADPGDRIVEKDIIKDPEPQIKIVRTNPPEERHPRTPLNEMKAGYGYALGKVSNKYTRG